MDEHANRVLAYMAQTADEGIEFKSGGEAELVAYSDSDWAVAHSTTGFCITFGGAALSYDSKRQHCISFSPTEAEIVAVSHTAAEVIYLRGLLAEMVQEQQRPTTMHVDNSGAVELSKERRSCQRLRHVDRHDLMVREYVANGCIEVRKIHTDENVADVFAKALPAHVHNKHVSAARGVARPGV
eukprot:4427075-Pleurochrysis_carterae.AAC.4